MMAKPMKLGICSYSLHRSFAAGTMDVFAFIDLCVELNCTQLDPLGHHILPALDDPDYRGRLQKAAENARLPFGCIAVDGADVYEPELADRHASRKRAHRWLDILATIGARQVRIDAGDPVAMTDDVFAVLVEGYEELVARGRRLGLEILMENHRGALQEPTHVVRLLEAVPGLGLLFDTNNWAAGRQQAGWAMTAPYAKATHIKTFHFDELGDDPTVDLHHAIQLLQTAGYDGAWGIESTPRELDELEAVRKTIALLQRLVHEGARSAGGSEGPDGAR
jgi:sugar phosphate isomerase/epimerase